MWWNAFAGEKVQEEYRWFFTGAGSSRGSALAIHLERIDDSLPVTSRNYRIHWYPMGYHSTDTEFHMTPETREGAIYGIYWEGTKEETKRVEFVSLYFGSAFVAGRDRFLELVRVQDEELDAIAADAHPTRNFHVVDNRHAELTRLVADPKYCSPYADAYLVMSNGGKLIGRCLVSDAVVRELMDHPVRLVPQVDMILCGDPDGGTYLLDTNRQLLAHRLKADQEFSLLPVVRFDQKSGKMRLAWRTFEQERPDVPGMSMMELNENIVEISGWVRLAGEKDEDMSCERIVPPKTKK